MGKRGTPECSQCALSLRTELNERLFGLTPDCDKWEENPCIDLKERIGDVLISTVFLHIDHNFGSAPGPLFYETIIFDNCAENGLGYEIYCSRHHSKKEAITKHNIIVSFLEKQPPEEFREWIKLIRNEHAA